jgi:hypothetical protein
MEEDVIPRSFSPGISGNTGRKFGITTGFAVAITAVRLTEIPQNI